MCFALMITGQNCKSIEAFKNQYFIITDDIFCENHIYITYIR